MKQGAGRATDEGPETAAAYRDDLAYIHDAGFGGFARQAGQVLVDALARRGITEGLVIDLGCDGAWKSEWRWPLSDLLRGSRLVRTRDERRGQAAQVLDQVDHELSPRWRVVPSRS
jgi:hypothetical protein